MQLKLVSPLICVILIVASLAAVYIFNHAFFSRKFSLSCEEIPLYRRTVLFERECCIYLVVQVFYSPIRCTHVIAGIYLLPSAENVGLLLKYYSKRQVDRYPSQILEK